MSAEYACCRHCYDIGPLPGSVCFQAPHDEPCDSGDDSCPAMDPVA